MSTEAPSSARAAAAPEGGSSDPATPYESALLQALPDGVVVVDADGCVEYVNEAFLQWSGWSSARILGHGFMRLVPQHLHRDILAFWNDVQLHATRYTVETAFRIQPGAARKIQLSLVPFRWEETSTTILLIKDLRGRHVRGKAHPDDQERLAQKVQERTAALVEINSRLSRSEAALARAQATAHIGSWEWQMGQDRPEWSREMFLLHGVPHGGEAPTYQQILGCVHPDDREQVRVVLNRMLATGKASEQEYRLVQQSGRTIEVLAKAQPSRDAAGQTIHLSGTLQDITERRSLEREIVAASQNEQQRIGRDLHDTLGQELTGISLLAKALENQMRVLAPKQADGAAALSRLTSQAASHARDIAHGLSPVDIAEEGLSAELAQMALRISSLYGLQCEFQASAEDRVHNNAVATHLYHIAQEAVTNAIKHAQPETVRVSLAGGDPGSLSVRNDHAPSRPAAHPRQERPGRGLRIMRHRADIIKAKLSIEHENGGTHILCVFPNPKPGTAAAAAPAEAASR